MASIVRYKIPKDDIKNLKKECEDLQGDILAFDKEIKETFNYAMQDYIETKNKSEVVDDMDKAILKASNVIEDENKEGDEKEIDEESKSRQDGLISAVSESKTLKNIQIRVEKLISNIKLKENAIILDKLLNKDIFKKEKFVIVDDTDEDKNFEAIEAIGKDLNEIISTFNFIVEDSADGILAAIGYTLGGKRVEDSLRRTDIRLKKYRDEIDYKMKIFIKAEQKVDDLETVLQEEIKKGINLSNEMKEINSNINDLDANIIRLRDVIITYNALFDDNVRVYKYMDKESKNISISKDLSFLKGIIDVMTKEINKIDKLLSSSYKVKSDKNFEVFRKKTNAFVMSLQNEKVKGISIYDPVFIGSCKERANKILHNDGVFSENLEKQKSALEDMKRTFESLKSIFEDGYSFLSKFEKDAFTLSIETLAKRWVKKVEETQKVISDLEGFKNSAIKARDELKSSMIILIEITEKRGEDMKSLLSDIKKEKERLEKKGEALNEPLRQIAEKQAKLDD